MKNHLPELQFLGATKTVTGSKSLLKYEGVKILVDCGLFQGPKAMREMNWSPFPMAKEIDAVVLTHAHVDHCGYLPKLVKEGFQGPIYCSPGTYDLCKIILLDSAHLQEEDAKFANKTKHSSHRPALPLYTIEDAHRALKQFRVLKRGDWHELYPKISVRLLRSGHILGSSFVQFSLMNEQKTMIVTFSGDIGNGRQNVIKAPVSLVETDYLIMEATYGDRVQSRVDPSEELAKCIQQVAVSKGVLVIPSFAVGRTQEILYLIRQLESSHQVPHLPVFLDSPMAIEATEIYLQHQEDLKLQLVPGTQGLTSPLCTHCYTATQSTEESMRLCERDGPMIVISAAGMLTGGRILHHLKTRLPHPENIVLFVGWQAEQTKGRLLQQGLPKIRLHHVEVPVKAQIQTIESLSAHGDTIDIMEWMEGIEKKPKRVFLNHGELSALTALQYRIEHELHVKALIPNLNDSFALEWPTTTKLSSELAQ